MDKFDLLPNELLLQRVLNTAAAADASTATERDERNKIHVLYESRLLGKMGDGKVTLENAKTLSRLVKLHVQCVNDAEDRSPEVRKELDRLTSEVMAMMKA